MVITDAAGSDHALRGIDATRKKTAIGFPAPHRTFGVMARSGATAFSLAMQHASVGVFFCFTWLR
jgi:hypothetical protein